MERGSRIGYIDICKGIAIILVVFGHAIDNVVNGYLLFDRLESFEHVHMIIYGFHMPVFFFCSGLFVFSWVDKPVKVALADKALRLIVPYFSWVIVVTIVKLSTSKYQNNPIELKDVFLSPIKPFEQYWFLYILFFIYVVYYFVYKFSLEYYYLGFIGITTILVPFFPDVWVIKDFFKYSLFFLFGTLMHNKRFIDMKNKYLSITFAFITVNVFLIKTDILQKRNTPLFHYYWLLTSMVGILWILMSSVYIDKFIKKKGLLTFCGRKSMEIYCIHPTILGVLRVMAEKTIGSEFAWIRTICVSCFTVIICKCLFSIWSGHDFVYKTLFGSWNTSSKLSLEKENCE